MNKLIPGFISGFVATVVLSVMMLAKGMMGIMPELDVIAMLSAMMGMPVAMAWLGHFMIGTLAWGGGFAILHPLLSGGSSTGKGIVFGIGAWIAMMIMVMPMAGAGFFGMNLGIMAPMMTLVLHIVFGAVLGRVFQFMSQRKLASA
ncbi:MAG: hypothetical protein K8F90_18550 [Hyphomicrobiales bacterium]|nr:hypothetical protein [Hyphomicrobiales bacterium]